MIISSVAGFLPFLTTIIAIGFVLKERVSKILTILREIRTRIIAGVVACVGNILLFIWAAENLKSEILMTQIKLNWWMNNAVAEKK